VAGLAAPASPELRVYLMLDDLQPQFAAYLGTPTRARGYPPYAGQHALIVEVAPGLAIERVTDLALRSVPGIEPGILFVERQFGVLEVHADDQADTERAGQAILDGIGAKPTDQLRPTILYHDVIEDVSDQHAVIINRNRQASMLLPGDSLLVFEMTPALFAAMAANEAEKAAPEITLVDVQMIGAAGRVYIGGTTEVVNRAREAIGRAMMSVQGREQDAKRDTEQSSTQAAPAAVAGDAAASGASKAGERRARPAKAGATAKGRSRG
jgi:hypothetical protein